MTPTTRAPKPAPGAIAVFVGRPGRGFERRYEAVAYSGNFEIMGTLGERESGGETNARRIANLARVAIESWEGQAISTWSCTSIHWSLHESCKMNMANEERRFTSTTSARATMW